jgi:hypothetical protein
MARRPHKMATIVDQETQAVADMLWFWAALFDGPPPEPLWEAWCREGFAQVAGLWEHRWPPVTEAFTPANLRREYEALLVPEPDSPLSLYDDEQPSGGEGISAAWAGDGPDGDDGDSWWMLTAALDLPWRKAAFEPGRAYPVRPDHLSVLLAIWATLLPAPGGAMVAGRPVGGWRRAAADASVRVLRRLAQQLPDSSGYGAIARWALAYAQAVREWQAKEGMHR